MNDKIQQKHKNAAKELLELLPFERMQLIVELEQNQLDEEERGKTHALSNFRLSSADWTILHDHMLDGGGTTNASLPINDLLTAVLNNDQTTFWSLLFHAVKSASKHLGIVIKEPTGHVKLNGIGPTMNPPPIMPNK